MTHDLLSTFLRWMQTVAPALSRPSFFRALVVACGWILTTGGHAVTAALVATGVAARRHHAAFHRFFSRGTWSPDEIGRLIFLSILRLLVADDAVIDLVLDDTLTPHKGPKIHGIGSHLDPVHSTRGRRFFLFGHVWVVLSVVVRVPFSRRLWALPVLFRLYRTKKECQRRRSRYRKRTELGREMIDVLRGWALERRVRISMDSAYSNRTVVAGLPRSTTIVGVLHSDAALSAEPPAQSGRGRRRVRGERLPSPRQLCKDRRQPWRRAEVFIYGQRRTIYYKTLLAQWYSVTGKALVHVVVVRVDHGKQDFRAFFSTDISMSPEEIIETYAGRWATETLFYDLKQELGFADPRSRTRAAVERTAPFVGYLYSLLVLWFADDTWKSPLAEPPTRPWYRTKEGHSFADILRCAQRVLPSLDFSDPERSVADLRKKAGSRARAGPMGDRLAA